jgi:hypothetical protein
MAFVHYRVEGDDVGTGCAVDSVNSEAPSNQYSD